MNIHIQKIIESQLLQNIWKNLIILFIKGRSPIGFATHLILGPQITQIAKNLLFPFSISFNCLKEAYEIYEGENKGIDHKYIKKLL